MNFKSLLFVFLSCSILLSFIPINLVFAYPTPIEVIGLSNIAGECEFVQQRDCHIINGTIWAFGQASSEGIYDGIYLRYSTDNGSSWSGYTEVFGVTNGYSWNFDSVYDGTYVHFYFNRWNDDYYKRGIFYPNGTISWSAGLQSDTLDDHRYGNSIFVDDDGYFWEATDYLGTLQFVENQNNDGTINLDTHNIDATSGGTGYDMATQKIFGYDGDVYCLYSSNGMSDELRLNGWTEEDAVMGSTEIVAASTMADFDAWSSCQKDNLIYIFYLASSTIYMKTYDLDTATLSSAVSVEGVQSTSIPSATYDPKGEKVYVKYIDSGEIYYHIYDTVTAELNATEAQFSNTLADLDSNWNIYGHDEVYEDELFLCYYGTDSDTHMVLDWLDPDRTPSVAEPEAELNIDLEDIDEDGADWVFTDWRYYDFNLTFNAYAENMSLQMSLPTSFETVTVGVFANSTYQNYSSNLSYETREGELMRLGSTSYSFNSSGLNYTQIIFSLWFEQNCLDVWLDADAVDVYYSYNGSSYDVVETGGDGAFRIYSKGGFTLNGEVSDSAYASLVTGESPFSFSVDDDGGTENQWAYNEIWFRDLQHVKLLPDIHFLAGYDAFTVEYGIDYSTGDGEWLEGWWVNIQPDFVSYTGVFAGNVWINMTITYNDRLNPALVVDDAYMFYHGAVASSGDEGHFQCWLDLWFSDKNASTVGAARVNAYEFPMNDNADLWLRWLANNWGVKDDVEKMFRGESSLYASDNSTLSSESIKMVRVWSNITVYSAGGGQEIVVDNFGSFDFTHSPSLPLTGISEPVFEETIQPIVGSKGILSALWTLFANIGNFLGENVLFGGLNLWGTFVAFLDTIAGLFGAPTFFSDLFTWIGDSVSYIGTAFDYLIEIISDVFDLFASLLGTFLGVMGDLIGSLVNFVTTFTDMMGGAYGAGVDLWETLGISQWITVAMIFYPLYLVILWDQDGMDAVIQQLTWIFGLLSWVFEFMSSVISEAILLITSLIESIPVAE